jgi:F0F1-type ATP synthase assembly protein I
MTQSDPGEDDSSRQQLTRQGAAAYQGALEAVLAIVVATGIGLWVDRRFDTAPLWLIVGGVRRLRVVRAAPVADAKARGRSAAGRRDERLRAACGSTRSNA